MSAETSNTKKLRRLKNAVLLKRDLPGQDWHVCVWFETKHIYAYNFYLYYSEWRVFCQNVDSNSKFMHAHTVLSSKCGKTFTDLLHANVVALSGIIDHEKKGD